MKVVIDTRTDTILGRWRGDVLNSHPLVPVAHRYEVQGVSMFADHDERFKTVAGWPKLFHVAERDVFECDFCNALRPNETLLKVAAARPSEPHSYCSIMWGCTTCGNGRPDAEIAAELEAKGLFWEG